MGFRISYPYDGNLHFSPFGLPSNIVMIVCTLAAQA